MIKLKDGIDKNRLRNFGFKTYNYNDDIVIKEIGALSIYIDLKTRNITGIGFYPVGDRIVLDNIKGLVSKRLVDID